jgi:hypothetical protein
MRLFHRRERRHAALLALGVLEGEERTRALGHVAACAPCRTEHDETLALLGRLADDPWRAAVRAAEVPVPSPFLVARVEQRIDEVRGRRRTLRRFGLALALPSAAVAALALTVGVPWLRRPSPAVPAPEAPMVSAAAFDRLERNVAREQAARYLGDAHDVLATVAASPRDCDRAEARVDVEAESRRSRALLARRAFLLGEEESAVASAQPVLDDVEEILREVASMEGCARFRDVERLQAEISRRHLLMKMRLMQRELLG